MIFHNILLATDFGPSSRAATDLAIELAQRFGAKLTVVHACDVPVGAMRLVGIPTYDAGTAESAEFDRETALIAARYANVESTLVLGPPADEILTVADVRGVDLVVLGTHGRHGLARAVMGSVAESVVRRARVPVLTTHAKPDVVRADDAMA